MAAKQTIRDVDVRGKRVFVRVDFNVPLDADLTISDDTRIRAALPTISYLRDQGAIVLLASHLGRPRGRVVEEMRLKPVARRLAQVLATHVEMAPDSVGDEVQHVIVDARPGDVILLENLRFHDGEEANDPEFARRLASLADLYVNDAFGSAHRAHASTVGVATFLPAFAGFLMERELQALSGALDNPDRPFVVIIGGAKISSKIGVLKQLLRVADIFLIGGGMANTLLKTRGVEVGASLVENDKLALARDFMSAADDARREVHLPVDAVVTTSVAAGDGGHIVAVDRIGREESIADIGPRTVEDFGRTIGRGRTILWNGPMGIFEMAPFAAGTRAIARLLSESDATTIVGGGDSVAAVEQAGLGAAMSHISTGGGASLEFLEGRTLPGVQVLADRDS